jgi:hypothetical protein
MEHHIARHSAENNEPVAEQDCCPSCPNECNLTTTEQEGNNETDSKACKIKRPNPKDAADVELFGLDCTGSLTFE